MIYDHCRPSGRLSLWSLKVDHEPFEPRLLHQLPSKRAQNRFTNYIVAANLSPASFRSQLYSLHQDRPQSYSQSYGGDVKGFETSLTSCSFSFVKSDLPKIGARFCYCSVSRLSERVLYFTFDTIHGIETLSHGITRAHGA